MAISACDERMLRVVVFDSTHTQGSSKYFLITITKQDTEKELSIIKNQQMKTSTTIKPADSDGCKLPVYGGASEVTPQELGYLFKCSTQDGNQSN